MLLKCSVNWVRFGLFSSFCSLAQSSTSGIWRRSAGVDWGCSSESEFKQCWATKRQWLLYLDLIEELGVQESKLICNLMTAEVVERSWPVRTRIHISSPDQMELNYPTDCETFDIIFFPNTVLNDCLNICNHSAWVVPGRDASRGQWLKRVSVAQ